MVPVVKPSKRVDVSASVACLVEIQESRAAACARERALTAIDRARRLRGVLLPQEATDPSPDPHRFAVLDGEDLAPGLLFGGVRDDDPAPGRLPVFEAADHQTVVKWACVHRRHSLSIHLPSRKNGATRKVKTVQAFRSGSYQIPESGEAFRYALPAGTARSTSEHRHRADERALGGPPPGGPGPLPRRGRAAPRSDVLLARSVLTPPRPPTMSPCPIPP
jgi:hypothetical protein